jgi:type II secretory pathway component PulF
MHAVLYVALFAAIGAFTGLMLFSLFFGLLFAMVIGAVLIFGRRRSTQQDALIAMLAIAAEHRMPLEPALDAFAGQCQGEYRRKVMAASHYVRQGLSLADAVDNEPGLFPSDVEVLIRVGGDAGVLAESLREAVAVRSAARGPWGELVLRLCYINVVLIVMESIVAFVSYFIMPKFQAIAADFGVPLPAVTIATIDVTNFVVMLWPVFLILMLAEIGFLVCTTMSVLGVLSWDLPLLDRIFFRRHAGLILRCLARLVEGDRPLGQGLASLARVYPVPWIRKRLALVAVSVERGQDWCEALYHQRIIGGSEAALLESAKRVGNLPWALRQAAERNERRLMYRIQAWVQWVMPLILICVGGIVFIVAFAYFTPLLFLISRLT